MSRPQHYIAYEWMNEIVPGVFVDPSWGLYIVDDEGEVCCWIGSEWAEDPVSVTSMACAVALATAKGTSAVRENIKQKGTILENLIGETYARQNA
jgi:hypothetical protein